MPVVPVIWDSRIEVHVFNQPTDMRKSHDGLAAICRSVMDCDPLSGHVFVFMNKRRDRVKSLFWDGTGLCLFYKRIEHGQFTNLWRADRPARLSTMELRLILEGAKLEGKLPLTPVEFTPGMPSKKII